MNKREANIKAAKMLGFKIDVRRIYDDESEYDYRVGIEVGDGFCRDFCVFTYPADCLAVVKALGEHGINVRPIYNSNNKMFGWSHYDVFNDFDCERTQDTLEEAVAAAVMEVSDE